MDNNSEYKIQLYTTSLMLMIASADNNVENEELNIIKNHNELLLGLSFQEI